MEMTDADEVVYQHVYRTRHYFGKPAEPDQQKDD
jgi:hypothetical protein